MSAVESPGSQGGAGLESGRWTQAVRLPAGRWFAHGSPTTFALEP